MLSKTEIQRRLDEAGGGLEEAYRELWPVYHALDHDPRLFDVIASIDSARAALVTIREDIQNGKVKSIG